MRRQKFHDEKGISVMRKEIKIIIFVFLYVNETFEILKT